MIAAATDLLSWGTAPWLIAIAIILTSFILEDAATIGTALLAADGTIQPSLGLMALFIGIFLGDVSLYGLGWLARENQRLRDFIGPARIEKGRLWLEKRYIRALITARCVPGLRLPAFTTSGYLKLSFPLFLIVAATASLIWSVSIFTLVFYFGRAFIDTLGVWRWVIAVAVIVAVTCGPWLLHQITLRWNSNAKH